MANNKDMRSLINLTEGLWPTPPGMKPEDDAIAPDATKPTPRVVKGFQYGAGEDPEASDDGEFSADALRSSGGKKSLDPEDYRTYPKFISALNKVSVDDLAEIINSGEAPWAFFPSGWGDAMEHFGKKVPYPGRLAEALILSKDNESLTDIANVYYARHRNLSPEAIEIFREDAVRTGKRSLCDYGISGSVDQLFEEEPEIIKQIILTMNPDELEQFRKAQIDYGYESAEEVLAKLGL